MKKLIELAPAKINLYLKVLGKRADGYHEIETLFERINIFDRITVSPIKEGIKIICDNSSIPTEKGSLCYRAVELLKEEFKIDSGVQVKIEKKIPVASGLGGGSSDAASILKALNRLWGLKLSQKELMEISKTLGADVPFFLVDNSFAIGRGRGDIITPIASKKSFWHIVLSPNIMLLSSEIYSLYSESHSLTLTSNGAIDKILSPAIDLNDINRLKKLLHNDLEKIVLSKEPRVKNIKNILEKIERGNTLVSGSGPCVFSLYQTRKEAEKARRDYLRGKPELRGCRMFISRTC